MSTAVPARAVLLDMDGTLVDSTAVVERIWSDWAAKHALDRHDVLAVIHGRQGHESMAELLPDRSPEENLAENDAMLARETSELDGVVEVPGAAGLLAALADVPHALVTSANRALATARMAAAGLPLPDVRVTSEDVRASKPDPEGFLRAADLLGVPAEDCVVLEDSTAGIAAARAAGMRVVGVGAGTTDLGADVEVADLRGLSVQRSGDGWAVLAP